MTLYHARRCAALSTQRYLAGRPNAARAQRQAATKAAYATTLVDDEVTELVGGPRNTWHSQ